MLLKFCIVTKHSKKRSPFPYHSATPSSSLHTQEVTQWRYMGVSSNMAPNDSISQNLPFWIVPSHILSEWVCVTNRMWQKLQHVASKAKPLQLPPCSLSESFTLGRARSHVISTLLKPTRDIHVVRSWGLQTKALWIDILEATAPALT